MPRASKACSHPDCPHLQPCPDHPKIPWAGSTRRQTLPSNWSSSIVPRILQRDPVCTICGDLPSAEVHHVGDRLDHRDENLAGVCADCHAEETKRQGSPIGIDAVPNYSGPTPELLLALVGPPASGKTWLGSRLADELGWPYRSIDDCGTRGQRGRRWTVMLEWVAEHSDGRLITESNIVPAQYRSLLETAPHLVIEVYAPPSVRYARLEERGGWDTGKYPVGFHTDAMVNGDSDGLRDVLKLLADGVGCNRR